MTAGLEASQVETALLAGAPAGGTGLASSQLQAGLIYTPPGGLDSGTIETFILAMPGGFLPRTIMY